MICHVFDNDSRSYSLAKVDSESYNNFVSDNENSFVIEQLKTARNKLFAHRDSGIDPKSITIPSVEKVDSFFNRLEDLYNKHSGIVEKSATSFNFAEDVKHVMEILYMNLERGEAVRLKEIDIEWLWEKDDNKASKKV